MQFVKAYLLSWLGEVIWTNPGSPNPEALRLVQDIIRNAKNNTTGKEQEKALKLKDQYFLYASKNIADSGGGGDGDNGGKEMNAEEDKDFRGPFAIIYTEVNLDEL